MNILLIILFFFIPILLFFIFAIWSYKQQKNKYCLHVKGTLIDVVAKRTGYNNGYRVIFDEPCEDYETSSFFPVYIVNLNGESVKIMTKSPDEKVDKKFRKYIGESFDIKINPSNYNDFKVCYEFPLLLKILLILLIALVIFVIFNGPIIIE